MNIFDDDNFGDEGDLYGEQNKKVDESSFIIISFCNFQIFSLRTILSSKR